MYREPVTTANIREILINLLLETTSIRLHSRRYFVRLSSFVCFFWGGFESRTLSAQNSLT